MQVLLVLALILNLILTLKAHVDGCFPEEELESRFKRLSRRHVRKGFLPEMEGEADLPWSLAKTKTTGTCPVALFATSPEYSNRSISPWSTSLDVDETRYPTTISVAQCLCKGCIINGSENMSYVSVPLSQSKMVLKKIPCRHGDGGLRKVYSVRTEYIHVPIGCTCVVPLTRHNKIKS